MRTSLLAALLLAAGCDPVISGSSAVSTLTLTPGDFDRLDLFHEVRTKVVRGPERRVEVTINDNLREYLVASASGGELQIGMRDGFSYQNVVLEAEITMPSLATIDLSGAARADLLGFDAFAAPAFDARLSGDSVLRGRVVVDRLALKLSGDSAVVFGGSSRELTLTLSGSTNADLEGVTARVAVADLSGSSRAIVLVESEVRGRTSGAAELAVRGDATIRVTTSGGSSVTRR